MEWKHKAKVIGY